jgi:hypothetical protein
VFIGTHPVGDALFRFSSGSHFAIFQRRFFVSVAHVVIIVVVVVGVGVEKIGWKNRVGSLGFWFLDVAKVDGLKYSSDIFNFCLLAAGVESSANILGGVTIEERLDVRYRSALFESDGESNIQFMRQVDKK